MNAIIAKTRKPLPLIKSLQAGLLLLMTAAFGSSFKYG
jgi:hypothetical protein